MLVAKGTNLGIPSASRDLPEAMIGQPLRGLLVVDCAGPADLEVVTIDELGAQRTVGSIPCHVEPQVMTFAIPGVVGDAMPPAFVSRLGVDPVPNDGSIDGINRALILVASVGVPDPDQEALLATFAAAYGPERPH